MHSSCDRGHFSIGISAPTSDRDRMRRAKATIWNVVFWCWNISKLEDTAMDCVREWRNNCGNKSEQPSIHLFHHKQWTFLLSKQIHHEGVGGCHADSPPNFILTRPAASAPELHLLSGLGSGSQVRRNKLPVPEVGVDGWTINRFIRSFKTSCGIFLSRKSWLEAFG